MLEGKCLCGAARYRIEDDPVVVAHCHCVDCQKASGTGHATGAMFLVQHVRLTGTTTEFQLKAESGNVVTRAFCPVCGSPISGRNSDMPAHLTIALGTLDNPGALSPQVIIFARNRPGWDAMDAGLPAFEAQPARQPPQG